MQQHKRGLASSASDEGVGIGEQLVGAPIKLGLNWILTTPKVPTPIGSPRRAD